MLLILSWSTGIFYITVYLQSIVEEKRLQQPQPTQAVLPDETEDWEIGMFCQGFNFGLQSGALLSITQLNFLLSATNWVSQIYYTLVVENSKLQFFQREIRISFFKYMYACVSYRENILALDY